jgi:glycosyltransferase involved in cell wall biosynthesis
MPRKNVPSIHSPYRVAYLVSHPIQYQAPLLRYIVAHSDIELTAFFLSDFSVKAYQDEGFGTAVEWDVPLLEGYPFEVLPALGGNQRLTPLRPFVYGLARHLRAGRFDALWVHGYAHQANLRAMFVAKSLGMKVFLRTDSQLASSTSHALKGWLKTRLLRRLFRTVDGFLIAGALNREYFRHYGAPEAKMFLLPFAVDNEFFQQKAALARLERERLRTDLGLSPGRPVILFASKFLRRKRAGDLLEAYRRLSPDGREEPRPYLLFVGDGEQKAALEAQAQALGWSTIRFLGFKNQMELPPLFDLCDVFVLPADSEPWGLIVNEVMNAAKPVIVTDQVGAAPDLVRDGENGYVVPVGDPAALARRLQDIICDPDKARRMGERSLEIIQSWGFGEDVVGLRLALDATVGAG